MSAASSGQHIASTDLLRVAPIRHARGILKLPGSKSISIRALLLSAFTAGQTTLVNLLDCDDTKVMLGALEKLGVGMRQSSSGLVVQGRPTPITPTEPLYMGNSGLSMRTLLPALAAAEIEVVLDGVKRMQERPIGDLVSALRGIGADIAYLGKTGFPPLRVGPAALSPSRAIVVAGNASSQFLSGLLQAAPLWRLQQDICIEVSGVLISRPYVALTIDLMRRFGVDVEGDLTMPAPRLRVAAQARYQSPGRLLVEGDASSASYFLALGALTGGDVRIEGIEPSSVQPDIAFLEQIKAMGATVSSGSDYVAATSPGVAHGFRFRPLDADLNHIPDAAMTLAVMCLFASGPSRLTNIGSWRLKETDRLAAMARELRKFGATIDEGDDWIGISPPERLLSARVDTYDDHRMAMSLALVACGDVAVEVRDPACVSKTFPDYFERLFEIGQLA